MESESQTSLLPFTIGTLTILLCVGTYFFLLKNQPQEPEVKGALAPFEQVTDTATPSAMVEPSATTSPSPTTILVLP